jgi:hypothetical protein
MNKTHSEYDGMEGEEAGEDGRWQVRSAVGLAADSDSAVEADSLIMARGD